MKAVVSLMKRLAGVTTLLIASMIPGAANAYKITPLYVEMDPSSGDTRVDYTITNPHGYPLTMDIYALKRVFNENGETEPEYADEEFLVFPPQLSVAPGESRRVRAQFLGASPSATESYRIVFEQIPVAPEEAGGKREVQIAVKFQTAVYVQPASPRLNVAVKSVTPREAGGYDVVVENSGNKLLTFSRAKFTGRDQADAAFELDTKKINFAATPVIPPYSTRKLFISEAALNGGSSLKSLVIAPSN